MPSKKLGTVCLSILGSIFLVALAHAHYTSRDQMEIVAESVPEALPTETHGKLYTPRSMGCDAYYACEDVVVVSGRCLGSDPVSPEMMRFERLPEGKYKPTKAVRMDFYLGSHSGYDLALVKLARAHDSPVLAWKTRIPHEGLKAENWVDQKLKHYCGVPIKQLQVSVYPGYPAEVSGHIAGRTDVNLIECPTIHHNGPGCDALVLENDRVTLLAKQFSNNRIRFLGWKSIGENLCPCAEGETAKNECSFQVKDYPTSRFGCFAVYSGEGIPPVAKDTVKAMRRRARAKSQPTTAEFYVPGFSRAADPGRYLGLTSEAQ